MSGKTHKLIGLKSAKILMAQFLSRRKIWRIFVEIKKLTFWRFKNPEIFFFKVHFHRFDEAPFFFHGKNVSTGNDYDLVRFFVQVKRIIPSIFQHKWDS